MRAWGVVAATLLALAPTAAHGKALTRTTGSGKVTLMYRYGNWQRDCSSDGGIVKVRTKPQHGKLTSNRAPIMIYRSRFSETTKCFGKTIDGFLVYYTSDPGFHGTDTFSIEVTYPKHPAVVDTFTVYVQ